MNLTSHPGKPVPGATLDEIIDRHGVWPVLKALVARSLRKGQPRTIGQPLSNHLRRDIGLPPDPPDDRFAGPR
jgi:hypothetical protein